MKTAKKKLKKLNHTESQEAAATNTVFLLLLLEKLQIHIN